MQNIEALRFPIGDFVYGKSFTDEETRQHIAVIEALPTRLTKLVGQWSDDRLDTPYRPGGWTIRQLVHHIADSHMNAYVRTKLALTESNPTISPYEEGEWAKLPDSALAIAPSLVLLQSLHLRWVTSLKFLTEADLHKTYFHPGSQRTFAVREVIALYAWHSEHHYLHAYRLAERNGWA